MKAGGRVINVGSTNAERMPFTGGAVYALSKSALQGLARGLARDLGPRGITKKVISFSIAGLPCTTHFCGPSAATFCRPWRAARLRLEGMSTEA
jgi:NAD(P)-dependent dehydrogenase (short-subunit alcohol dehydrogenase family)